MLTLTHHAHTRLQQRGIPRAVIENLLDFGWEAHDHHGSRILYFDRPFRTHLLQACSKDMYKRLEPHLDAFAVLNQAGAVITVGHRTRRINHA